MNAHHVHRTETIILQKDGYRFSNVKKRDPFLNIFFCDFLCADKPENVTLNVNISSERICAGVTVKFTCTADANPAVDTYKLYENGDVIANMSGSGVWIRTLNTGGQFDYRCEANNSVGTETSSDTTLIVEGKLA